MTKEQIIEIMKKVGIYDNAFGDDFHKLAQEISDAQEVDAYNKVADFFFWFKGQPIEVIRALDFGNVYKLFQQERSKK